MPNNSKALTFAFSLFIFVAIGYFLYTPKQENVSKNGITDIVNIPAKGEFIQVFYFHSQARCPSCTIIENNTKTSIESNFSKLLHKKKVGFISLNYQSIDNKNYVEQFSLYMPTVIVAKYIDGKIVIWKNLDKVWKLVHRKEQFISYIKDETDSIIHKGE